MVAGEVTIMGLTVKAGSRRRGEIHIAYMADGQPMVVPFWVINGVKPGKRLLLSAMTHGDACIGAEAIFKVMESIDEAKISGTIVAFPCVNPAGFEGGERNCTIDRLNMNRQFPGFKTGWFCDRVCASISPIFKECDACIDWHGGSGPNSIHYINFTRAGDSECIRMNTELAYAFGTEFLYTGKTAGPASQYEGTIQDEFIKQGKPCILAEIGGGIHIPQDQIKASVIGVHNVMKLYGMEDGEMELPQKQILLKRRVLARPSEGGLFIPHHGPELMNAVVPKDTLLFEVRNIVTGDILERYYTPYEQNAIIKMRGMISKVEPGDYGYLIGDMTDAEIRENF